MKLKLFILFLLVFAAIGQTIFLNIDAKSNFLQENSKNGYTQTSTTDLDENSIQSSEVVVTIRQHNSEILNPTTPVGFEVDDNTVSLDQKENKISTPSTAKKPCSQITKEERLVCQKAKEAAKQKQIRVSGSNQSKNSTIQTPAP